MPRNRSFPSPLAHDFEVNQEVYTQNFSVNGRMNWIALSESAHAKGLVNAEGQLPSPACCRLTWYRTSNKLNKLKRSVSANNAQNRPSRSVVVSKKVWPSFDEDDLGEMKDQSTVRTMQPGKKKT